jgi:rod shape-determining protein MreC
VVRRPRRRRPTGSRRPRWVTFAVLLLASVTIITLGYRGGLQGTISSVRQGAHDLFDPVQRATDGVLRPVASFVAGAAGAGSIEEQNARLRQQLQRLQGNQAANEALRSQLRSLEALQHLTFTPGIPTVAAQVVALSSSNFSSTVTLDKGASDGVGVGMPVVGGAGLVGKVIQVWSTGSTVELLTDGRAVLSVRYGPGDDLAAVVGRGQGAPLEVDYIVPGTPIGRGTPLTTAGLDGDAYPPGIPVATVESVSSSPSATAESVTAKPLADLGGLEFVDVLQWEPPLLPGASG